MKLYFSRKEQIAVVILLLAIVGALAVLGYGYLHKTRHAGKPVPFYEPGPATTAANKPTATATSAEVIVHVAGAVKVPGVYHCPIGSRIIDAVAKAGGARTDGYPDALNLAEKLLDGEKIYIPTKAEWTKTTVNSGTPPLVQQDTGVAISESDVTTTASATSTSSTLQAAPSRPAQPAITKVGPNEKINLNTAGKEELCRLPGVGAQTAQNILDYRTQHGKFTDFAQLLSIKRIGAKTLAKLQPHLIL